MDKPFFDREQQCEECVEPFWARRRSRYCSSGCRSRAWRRRNTGSRSAELAEICAEVLQRREAGSAAYSKLLPRLFRRAAAELRTRGWDPLELLISTPDEPATDQDEAPGGIEGTTPTRRRWHHPPDVEVQLLVTTIEQRAAEGQKSPWHTRRLAQLMAALEGRAP
jgi:hypothetical protein